MGCKSKTHYSNLIKITHGDTGGFLSEVTEQ